MTALPSWRPKLGAIIEQIREDSSALDVTFPNDSHTWTISRRPVGATTYLNGQLELL